jgi:hypothetical protein
MFRTLISTAAAGVALAALCLVAPAAVHAQSLNLNFPACTGGFGLTGPAGNQTLTCLTGGGGPAAFACSLTGAPSGTIASGAAVNLTMNCSGGTAPYSYSWTPGGSTAPSLSANPTVTTSYSVTARDSAGGSSTQSATVTVASGGGGGGGGGGGSYANCTSQGLSVIPASGAVNITWGLPASPSSGAFGDRMVWLFTMTVPANAPHLGSVGYFNVVENGGSPTIRQMSISTTPCDFRAPDYTGANGPVGMSQGVTVSIPYTTLFPSFSDLFTGNASLVPGTTYYISVRNFSTDFNSYTCPNSNCFAIMNEQPQH